MGRLTDSLETIAERIRQDFAAKDSARENTLHTCRDVIRHCSQAIRAVHRQEFEEARELLHSAEELLKAAAKSAGVCGELTNIGFLRDAQKEFAEGRITIAVVRGEPLPQPEELGVDPASYLGGMADAAGEIRRYLLDSMRKGDLSRGDELLEVMDDIYGVLVTMDFPDAITGGLRHSTDAVRGILERTRSDLTLTIRQHELEKRLGSA